jgi:hypothetical protein
MTALNLGLRFLLELCGIAALAAWGWSVSDALPLRLAAAVLAPAVLIVVWALVVAPRARNPVPQTSRMLIGTVLLLACAGLLAVAGPVGLAAVFAAANIANTALLLALGGPEGVLDADRATDPSRRP